ncbi:hypothetical protein ACP70R_001589 [Stipagrostis hirtigluma subsp. patula]
MAAPAPAPGSWVDLPPDTLYEIVKLLPCAADRGQVALACRPWRAALSLDLAPRPPRQLPWLLLPSPYPDGPTRACCVLSGCRVHHHLGVRPTGARCFGSHDGAWLFLAFPRGAVELLNVRTAVVFVLPRALHFHNDPREYGMAVHAAALSATPGDRRCVAGAVVDYWRGDPAVAFRRRYFALWRVRHRVTRVAFGIAPRENDPALEVEDVVYHDDAFHFLTQREHIRVIRTVLFEDGQLGASEELRRFLPGGRLYDQYVEARYLVVSRGELLLVVRFKPSPTRKTSAFRVFRLIEPVVDETDNNDVDHGNNPDHDDDSDDGEYDLPAAAYPWRWSELPSLQGRMLFVGHGCSRSYDVARYPGFTEGVYFMDDADDTMVFRDAAERQYSCGDDSGKWSEGPPRHVERCFPRQRPSSHSPPAWLLP